MTARRLEIFVIIVIIAVIGIVYAFKQNATLTPVALNQNGNSNVANNQQVPATVVSYQGQDGKTALEILKATHQVELKSFSFGDMVVSIDGIEPDANHFWAFYVNGQLAQVGASSYQTSAADTIKWQMDEIQN